MPAGQKEPEQPERHVDTGPQPRPSQAKVGKQRKPSRLFTCVPPEPLQHIFSLLKILFNKELPASGRPKPSPTRVPNARVGGSCFIFS